MRGGLGNMMKQAQQLQENMRRAQENLEKLEVIGTAASGKVAVTVSGKHEVRRVTIDPELLKGDAEMLEDLVAVACNDANAKIEAAMKESFSGIGLPPGLKLPF
ncbi:MAG TPA: YbaB/EbfC family nucleoid-associated protein [Gammaproteobacteria bacterium]|nr:YbaB/EbfC family nucleoid-associated protein [Gammaproteobacteria bacterium]